MNNASIARTFSEKYVDSFDYMHCARCALRAATDSFCSRRCCCCCFARLFAACGFKWICTAGDGTRTAARHKCHWIERDSFVHFTVRTIIFSFIFIWKVCSTCAFHILVSPAAWAAPASPYKWSYSIFRRSKTSIEAIAIWMLMRINVVWVPPSPFKAKERREKCGWILLSVCVCWTHRAHSQMERGRGERPDTKSREFVVVKESS